MRNSLITSEVRKIVRVFREIVGDIRGSRSFLGRSFPAFVRASLHARVFRLKFAREKSSNEKLFETNAL